MQMNVLDGYCKQLEILLGQLKVTLGFFYPILRIIDCLKLLVDLINKIAEVLGDPPKLLELLDMLVAIQPKCIDLFAELTFVVPTPFCKMVVDIAATLIALIECIEQMLTVSLGLGDRIAELDAQVDLDAALAFEKTCLEQQKAQLDTALLQKLESIESLVDILNILIGFVPPLVAAMGGAYPINLGSLSLSPAVLQDIKAALNVIKSAAETCA